MPKLNIPRNDDKQRKMFVLLLIVWKLNLILALSLFGEEGLFVLRTDLADSLPSRTTKLLSPIWYVFEV